MADQLAHDLRHMFNVPVIIHKWLREDMFGAPEYEAAGTLVRVAMVRKNRSVISSNNEEVVSTTRIWVPGDYDIGPLDKIIMPDNNTPRIIAVSKYYGPSGAVYSTVDM